MNYGCRVVYLHLDELVYLYNKIEQLLLIVEYFFIKTSHTKAGSQLLCNANINNRCQQISLKTKMIIIEKYFCYASSNFVVKAKINSKIYHWEIIYKHGKIKFTVLNFL